ncbi:MAG: sel1 repeat family protein [Clostridia bacterium]|nr:sel1 repeat family protein [Clostridia bacterium]
MRDYPKIRHLDWYEEIRFNGKEMTVKDFVKMYELENERPETIVNIINRLIKKGLITLINWEYAKIPAKEQELDINQGAPSNIINQRKHEKAQDEGITFEDCLKKHFPKEIDSLFLLKDQLNKTFNTNASLYELTLDMLRSYKGNYELANIHLAALIMHVKLGNITGYDLEELFKKRNWTEEFRYDVMYRLQEDNTIKCDGGAFNTKSGGTTVFNKMQDKSNKIRDKINKEYKELMGVYGDMTIEYITEMAENGDVEKQLLLGDLHLKGVIVDEDDFEAVKWYSMAVGRGSADAMSKLGEMYQYGYGVKANDFEAVKWYKKAAERNSANGQFRLGWMYQAGRGGLSQDFDMALKYFRLAARQGHKMAIRFADV